MSSFAVVPSRLPWSILGLSAALTVVGLCAIARAEALLDSGVPFASQQLRWALVALAAMILTAMLAYRQFAGVSRLVYVATLALLLLVFCFPPTNGAHRWLRVLGLGFQPSELAKLAFILALARDLMDRGSHRRLRGLVRPLLLTLIPMVLILREPDLGTALVFLPVLFAMLMAAGARLRDLAVMAVLGLLVLPLLWTQMSREQKSRVTALFEQSVPGERPTDDGYHLHQAKQVAALGGFWGSAITGDVVEDRAVYRLPVAHSDFVFSVIGERFGVVGAGIVLSLYALLIWRLVETAVNTREPFGRLVAAGVAALFGVEAVINSAMTVGLAPVTGLSLPLVSHGGSGLVIHAVALGLVLSVALHAGPSIAPEPFRFREKQGNRRG